MEYYLSTRQIKELFSRGSEIMIAIPAPDALDYDPLQYARGLIKCEPAVIEAAEETHINVKISWGVPSTLTECLGEIIPEDDSRWHLIVAVVLCRIRGVSHPRRLVSTPQWPHDVRLASGERLLQHLKKRAASADD